MNLRRDVCVTEPGYCHDCQRYNDVEEPSITAFGNKVGLPLYRALGTLSGCWANRVGSDAEWGAVPASHHLSSFHSFRKLAGTWCNGAGDLGLVRDVIGTPLIAVIVQREAHGG